MVKPKKAKRVKEDKKFKGIYWIEISGKRKKILATKNLVRGQVVYGERLFEYKGEEYREWIAKRSKLAAAIMKGIREFPIKEGDYVLYLGIASGTTASHISDIIGWEGLIYGIDISGRVLRKTYLIARKRTNIIPILADASLPSSYSHLIPKKVNVLYEDVAQKHQVDILIKNAEYFLKSNGYALFAVKARSIDVTKPPKEIFKEVEKKLKEYFDIIDKVRLEPYEKDHMFYVLKY